MKGPREPSHFVLPFGNVENREKRRRKGEGKKGKTRKKLGEWVETMGRLARAAVAGRQVESEIQKHEARSVENERHLRKRHVGGECDEPEVRTAQHGNRSTAVG